MVFFSWGYLLKVVFYIQSWTFFFGFPVNFTGSADAKHSLESCVVFFCFIVCFFAVRRDGGLKGGIVLRG
jgi:hypothetical protein